MSDYKKAVERIEKLVQDRGIPLGEDVSVAAVSFDELVDYATVVAIGWPRCDQQDRDRILESLHASPAVLTAMVMRGLYALIEKGRCTEDHVSALVAGLTKMAASHAGGPVQ